MSLGIYKDRLRQRLDWMYVSYKRDGIPEDRQRQSREEGSGVVVSCKREGDPRAEELLLCYSGLGL